MGLWTPAPAWGSYETNFGTPQASTQGTSVAASATPFTKGAWVQLIASTAFDYQYLEIWGSNSFTSTTNTRGLLDIGIGAAAAEVVLIPDLLMGAVGASQTYGGFRNYPFPLFIPAGTRVSARFSNATASRTIGVTIKGYGNPRRPGEVWYGSTVDAYGITAGSGQGVAITPGVSGAFGSYTQIVASTTKSHMCIIFGCQLDSQTNAAAQTYQAAVGVGAATEVEIANHIVWGVDASERLSGPWSNPPIWVPVPAASRLAVKLAQSSTTAQPCDVALYGVS